MTDLELPDRDVGNGRPGYASLVVLSYERPRLIQPSLASLIEHADYPYELIVHDDGSSDPELLDYLHKLHEAGAVSTLILNAPGHNQGQGTALNRGFRVATGDPIIKLDHDLLYRPGWLRTTVDILKANERSYYRSSPGSDERLIGLLGLLHYWHDPVHSDRTIVQAHDGWSEHTHILGSAFALRRETWANLGPFEEHSTAFAEDAEMQRAVTESGRYVCGLPPEDLCENIGMGYGPSTVNVAPGEVQSIHTSPRVFDAGR